MSKRSRRTKDDAQPANEGAPERENANEARPADHSHVEPTLVVSGAAFQQFHASIDAQLEELVGRWIHIAAPAASAVRRVVPQASRHGQT
jgi:hypothetical protein